MIVSSSRHVKARITAGLIISQYEGGTEVSVVLGNNSWWGLSVTLELLEWLGGEGVLQGKENLLETWTWTDVRLSPRPKKGERDEVMTKRGGVTEEKQQLDFMKFLLLMWQFTDCCFTVSILFQAFIFVLILFFCSDHFS